MQNLQKAANVFLERLGHVALSTEREVPIK
jgi:hypothetical protein